MSANIEDISDSEQQQQPGGTVTIDSVEGTRSRGETKSRKALSKLGLKKVEGITRVVMRRPRGQLVVIAQAEVYKSSISDAYIVFGEARTEEGSQNQFMQAQQQLMQAEAMERAQREAQAGKAVEGAGAKADDDDEDDESEEGVDAGDIDVVMQQANCSRAKAVKVLKKNKGDIVQAIMEAQ